MKTSVSELALFGGAPGFEAPLHVGRPNVGDEARFLERIQQMLARRWFTNRGPFVQELEDRIARYLGVRHCILTCNGTLALEIAIRALGLHGEVIVPSFTFIATAHALQWQEITPVFCDIDPRTHTLDPEQVERMITPRTTGIIGVHVWGQPCETEALSEIAARRGLELIYDASHAFGCSRQGRMIGSFGRAEVFSFHATKFFHTFEGGAIVTNDDELAAKARLMKNFGFAGYDKVIYIGTNGKMSEVSAAMGLTLLEGLDDLIAGNCKRYRLYRQQFDGLPGVRVYPHDETEKRNFHYVVLEIEAEEAGISRDLLYEILHKENVLARRYFYPGCHRMEPYRSYYPHAGLLLPETERLCDRVLVLPTGAALSEADIASVCRIIRMASCHGEEIRHRLERSPALAASSTVLSHPAEHRDL
jgi:dTDP-4-amino-4,6-dideoxygalactose transaminase